MKKLASLLLAALCVCALLCACGREPALPDAERRTGVKAPGSCRLLYEYETSSIDSIWTLEVYEVDDGGWSFSPAVQKNSDYADTFDFTAYAEWVNGRERIGLPDGLKIDADASEWCGSFTAGDNRYRDYILIYDPARKLLYVIQDVHQYADGAATGF